MLRRAFGAFKKHPARYPGVFIIVAATLLGAISALSQKFSLGEGFNAGFAVLFFTTLFILLPFWVLGWIVSLIYRRNKIDYNQGRLWLWSIPAALAVVMAVYYGIVGEQVQLQSTGNQAAAASNSETSGVIILFLYIYLGALGLVVGFVSAMFRLWLLKLKKDEGKT
ncbi:MAG TPA: hypothetical protein VHB72_04935 [Candidatus Saccharimonadales bacterium]|nr:hypothetical protein [Candidatus Saccharimonadales bacterium]